MNKKMALFFLNQWKDREIKLIQEGFDSGILSEKEANEQIKSLESCNLEKVGEYYIVHVKEKNNVIDVYELCNKRKWYSLQNSKEEGDFITSPRGKVLPLRVIDTIELLRRKQVSQGEYKTDEVYVLERQGISSRNSLITKYMHSSKDGMKEVNKLIFDAFVQKPRKDTHNIAHLNATNPFSLKHPKLYIAICEVQGDNREMTRVYSSNDTVIMTMEAKVSGKYKLPFKIKMPTSLSEIQEKQLWVLMNEKINEIANNPESFIDFDLDGFIYLDKMPENTAKIIKEAENNDEKYKDPGYKKTEKSVSEVITNAKKYFDKIKSKSNEKSII